ncbi:hypothetical protein LTR12_006003 [Friedmanniomyces endolithicus]|nr:hypothetical protein LTR74_011095 [Friedmanniomyces endolithicus]KAK1819554.1 hypothetical protein LTR12_006003 [Friedmanniomyces endolithicus]
MDFSADINLSDFDKLLEREHARNDITANPNAGKRVIDTILANQVVDRPLSKRNFRKQTFHSGALGTCVAQQSVANTWDAFCKTIKHNVKDCLSSEQIYCFIDIQARQMTPIISRKSAPLLIVIKIIWACLIELLVFRYRDLKNHY